MVGLNIKSGLSIVTLTVWIRSDTPSTICGSESLVTVKAEVCGSTWIEALTITLPRLNGPALAGVTIDRPNG